MNVLKSPEKAVIISVMLLIATGLIFIYSVSGPYSQQRELSDWHYFVRQLIWAGISLVILFVCSSLDYRKFLKLSPVLLFISLVFLVMVLFAPTQLHVHRWLDIGFLRFQPSEVFKISLLMYLAFVLVNKKGKHITPKKMLPHLAVALFGILLIAKQPDLGTMMLIFWTGITVLFLAGIKFRYLLTAVLAIIIVGGVMVFGLGYEKDRIDDYFASLKDPLNRMDQANPSRGYYQNRQSLISIGSGELLGRGLGGGGQKNLFLPAPHTDFIFSASAEEGGFVLCLCLLGLLFIFGMASLKIASNSVDLQGYLLAVGLGIMITLQAVINIGVALGLLPITGITLPYFSYGGSSLVISCAAAGLILSVARYGRAPRARFLRAR